jgi:uncharacterized protein with HEPN domain
MNKEVLRAPAYLSHTLQAIQRINRYTEDMDEIAFLQDERTQDAVIRNFEIIGEASRNIERQHSVFATEHSEVPWGIAYEMRNALAHGYFKVDLEIVWRTIQSDLPGLQQQIQLLLGKLQPDSET